MAAEPLRVVLYAGPGAGKSTTMAMVFALLKQRGRNVEMAHEFAKELTWEGNPRLAHQVSIAAEQMWRMDRLGDVEAIITDTSTLYGLVYGDNTTPWYPAFEEFLVAEYETHPTLNVLLERDPLRAYNPKGRAQTQKEAEALDDSIGRLLRHLELPYTAVTVDKHADAHAHEIVRLIEKELNDA